MIYPLSVNLNFGNNPGKEYYDKTIFTEAGLDPETPPATWDELEQYAEQIVEKTGILLSVRVDNFKTFL